MEFFNSLAGQLHAFVLAMVIFAQVLVGAIGGNSTVVVSPPALPASVATSSITSSTTSKVVFPGTTSTTSIQTPKKTATTSPSKNITQATPPISVPTPATPVTLIPTEQLNTTVRASLVNVLCTTLAGGSFAPISGSGVIIDTRGVVLTNAHVGQYFLIRDYGSPGNIQCIVRTGSPAQPTYTARLLYLPPTWVNANASQLISQQALGTGENDYAFLLLTGPAGPSLPYPNTFPALPMSASAPDVNSQVLLAGYPAGLLGGQTIQMNLYVSSALSVIKNLYTFNDPKNIDLISLGGTVVAQSGSSGGAVVSAQTGKLLGIIATETQGTTTSSRLLNAITIGHIDRSLNSSGQGGITTLLNGDLIQKANDFASSTAPSETQTLEAVLKKVSR